MGLEISLRSLPVEDRDELRSLVIETAWLIDHGSAELVHELFVDDGKLDLPGISLSGKEQIHEWGRRRAQMDRTTRHVCSNLRFRSDDVNSATVTSIAVVYVMPASGQKMSPPGIYEYEDDFVRTDSGWRFRSRRSLLLIPEGWQAINWSPALQNADDTADNAL